MTRRSLMFAGLVAAVAIAVLLRTAASQFERATADLNEAQTQVRLSVLEISDCTISADRSSHLISSDASQPAKNAPADAADIGIAHHANEQRVALSLAAVARAPATSRLALRPTIRPPPHIA
ncbi:MAG: hypothetical protein OXH38_05345 [Chloroflexi bacterium]|nr:hypothetical protein [Chloroflexota bacterium]